MSCKVCNIKTDIPFKCPFCGELFCEEHRLPEAHKCTGLPEKSWDTYKLLKTGVPNIEPQIIAPTIKEQPSIDESSREDWVDISDYDPNPKIVEDKTVEPAEMKLDYDTNPGGGESTEVTEKLDEKKYIFYQGRWMTAWEHMHVVESEKKVDEELSFLKRLFRRK
ncbi:MAG: AN1-type zinc finger protein [Candidatus Bathyarchaeota archaeon]|nr:AN1-type zinc finger protein [Candidatus Bathyarchaeota archaeon]